MKTVLITGASSGIGYELAKVYAEKGFNLFLTARRRERLKSLKDELEQQHDVHADYFPLDLSEPGSAEVLFAKTRELSLTIDILINNAGFGIYGPFLESTAERNEQMLNLNILSLTKLCLLYGKEMAERGNGHLVNVASTAAFQPVPFLAAYAASKSYVLQFSEALAYELKPKNVFVTAICPGATHSEFGQVAGFKDGEVQSNMPTSRQLAEFTFKQVQKKKVVAIHGSMNGIMTFGQRFLPRKLVTTVAGKMIQND